MRPAALVPDFDTLLSGAAFPMASVYDVGTRAWQPDTAEGWIASELVDKAIEGDKAKLTFKLENGEVHLFD